MYVDFHMCEDVLLFDLAGAEGVVELEAEPDSVPGRGIGLPVRVVRETLAGNLEKKWIG